MIIDNTIKKAILNDSRISEIHKGPILAWKEGEITSTVMATGSVINAKFNKNLIKTFTQASYNMTPPANAVDISEAGDGSVVTWYDTDSKTQYYKPIGVDKVLLNPDSSNMFSKCLDLVSISHLDTSKVTNMANMFYGCKYLQSIPHLDTSNVTNMSEMFYGCDLGLKSIPHLDTSNVTNMCSMFNMCGHLEEVPLLNTSKVTDMNNMFNSCYSLKEMPLLDTHNVTNMSYMFYGCISLTTIPLLDTSKVTNMRFMLQNCSSLKEIPLLDASSLTGEIDRMFNGCTALVSLDLSKFNTSKVTNMRLMFNDCTSLTTIVYGDKFVNDNCTNFSNMYQNCPANKPNWSNGTWDDTGTFTKTV